MAACLIPVGQVEDKHLLSLLQDMDVFDFCVDFDIVGYPKNRGAPVAVTPIVSVDSDLETTWVALTNVKVWWQKLQGFVYVIEKYNPSHNESAARLVREKLRTSGNIPMGLEIADGGVTVHCRVLTNED